jgi:hypothetical protein
MGSKDIPLGVLRLSSIPITIAHMPALLAIVSIERLSFEIWA